MSELHTDLRRARLLAGLTQQALGDLAGVGQSTISEIERGDHDPGIFTALMIAAALGCKVEDIFWVKGA